MTDPHLSSLTPVRSHIMGAPGLASRPRRRRHPAAAAVRTLIAAAAALGIALDALGAPRAVGLLHLLASPVIEANALVAVVCAAAALRAATGRTTLPAGLTGAAVLYITATALVYHLALGHDHGASAHTGTQTITGSLLHTAVPLAVAADWLLLTPAGRYRLRHSFRWLLYPSAYLAFVLTRGALLTPGTRHRYPYPFLDAGAHGYHRVLLDAMQLGVALWLLALGLVGLDHLRPSRRDGHNAISSPAAGPLE
ncbi:Pr6Pr family membrane protein [Streptomyces sp. RB6PN25]|uniref:Pr6Pr family membrane protein n=1 Tax=Streptomyces humicola TaxID=2953240 RepID=A0ABT1PU14_9ACTN|nr:Pr6Pr family membrane protein [Streptomyces humicola]MCQ4081180.1 Pr6Pr family membrane protein [Streptomyces humicola]